MAVSYVTLYLPDGTPVQVVEGGPLHKLYVARGANGAPPTPGPVVRLDPFPQYVDQDELTQALGGVGASDTAVAALVNDTGSQTRGALGAALGTPDVVAPRPTGVAATDTANLLQAIADTPVGGLLLIPGDDEGGAAPYVINQPLVISKSITVRGQSAMENFTGANLDFPTTPFVRGTVIKQTAAGANGITVSGTGLNVSLADLAVIFDAAIDGDTGHGFATIPVGTSVGIMGFRWENLVVHGHDGDHYGFYWHNPIHGTTDRLRSYGGGGFYTRCDTTGGNLGNMVHNHPTAMVDKTGTAHGFAHYSLSNGGASGYLNLITYIRPQCNVYSQVPSTQATWKDDMGPGTPGTIVAINPDMENAPGAPHVLVQGRRTLFVGGQLNRGDINNTSYGIGALANPEGGGNVAFGQDALTALTTGGGNVAVGYQALQSDTSGYSNTGVGAAALAAVTATTNNTGVGRGALEASTGESNTGVGAETTSGSNAASLLGYQASAGADAYCSVAVGFAASAGGGGAVAVGWGAHANALGSAAIGTDSAGTGASTSAQDEMALGTGLHRVKVAGRLNVARRTPTGSADAQGAVGDITSDDSYIYAKTSTGWMRAALTTF